VCVEYEDPDPRPKCEKRKGSVGPHFLKGKKTPEPCTPYPARSDSWRSAETSSGGKGGLSELKIERGERAMNSAAKAAKVAGGREKKRTVDLWGKRKETKSPTRNLKKEKKEVKECAAREEGKKKGW